MHLLHVGDASAASTLSEKEVDQRVRLYVDMEDPDIVLDLRSLHSGTGSKYNVFWDECAKFLQEDVGLAVEERRHSEVTHLANVRDYPRGALHPHLYLLVPGSVYNSGLRIRCTTLAVLK